MEHKIVRKIVDALEENIYPPEKMFSQQFVKDVEAAERSKGIKFKTKEELSKFLDGLERG